VVYAAGQRLAPGVHVQRVGLPATLARLGYVETRGAVGAPGQFRRAPDAWEIFLRHGEQGAPQRVRVFVAAERVLRVTGEAGELDAVTLDPEVLTTVAESPDERRRPVRLVQAPRPLVDAVLAAEDHRFLGHGGLDARALGRAVWANVSAGRLVQGGSTITQQLVKVRLLGPERTVARKLREAWLALLVEARYSKADILEAYLNEIYLGQRGAVAIRGVGAAAHEYFGKEIHQLTTAEAALLAGLIRAPNALSPALHPERAQERRDQVLARMRELGMLDEAEHARARREPVRVRPAEGGSVAYFLDHVRQELEQRMGREPESVASHVLTTLDLSLQRLAESAVSRGLDRLETTLPRLRQRGDGRRLQAALVALDPATGEIRALVGGRDYATSQFNRATLARRQPGSAFKPFVYLTALRPDSARPQLTAASVLDDAPLTRLVRGEAWSPRNYEDRYEGRVTVRRALERSLNAATVQVAERAGLPNIVATARALGVSGPLAPVPALALGAFEVTPLELALAYAPFANGGTRPLRAPAVREVRGADGTMAGITGGEQGMRVLSAAEAYLMTSLLMGVVDSGTGAGARRLGVSGPIAGKTGTTNDGRDAWFVGYAPGLLALVWVGFDGGEPHGLGGSQAALPIWADFMRQAMDTYAQPAFAVPSGIVFVDVDPTTGKVATDACPTRVREAFLVGTEPIEPAECEARTPLAAMTAWWDQVWSWLRR
jgi:penicillin-binding protein 1B